MHGGRLERLDKAPREADGDAVAIPLLAPHAALELDVERFDQRFADAAHQPVIGFVARQIAACVDDPGAHPVLQRDAPLPPGVVRDRLRIRHRRAEMFRLHRNRAVVGQPVAPVLEPRVQRAIDQQPAKAGAVDEHVALDPPLTIEMQRGDIARLAVQLDARDLALDALAAVGFGRCANLPCIPATSSRQ